MNNKNGIPFLPKIKKPASLKNKKVSSDMQFVLDLLLNESYPIDLPLKPTEDHLNHFQQYENSADLFAEPLPNNTREKVKPFLNILWELQNERCWYCGKFVCLLDATIDHKSPQRFGKETTYKNCVMSCFKCNNIKDFRTVSQFRAFLYDRKRNIPHVFFGEKYVTLFQTNFSKFTGDSGNMFSKNNHFYVQKILPLFKYE